MKTIRFWLFYILCGVLPTGFYGYLLATNLWRATSSESPPMLMNTWVVLPFVLLGVVALLRPFKPTKTAARVLLYVTAAGFVVLLVGDVLAALPNFLIISSLGMVSVILTMLVGHLFTVVIVACCCLPWKMRRARWIMAGIALGLLFLQAVNHLPGLGHPQAWRYYLNVLLVMYPEVALAAMALCPRPRLMKKKTT